MEKGLTLSWLKVVLICVAMLGSVYMTLVKADDKLDDAIETVEKEVKKDIKGVSVCKLDKVEFTQYKIDHKKDAQRMLDKFETEFKEVKKQVSDSENKIIRVLTIQEERRTNGG